MKMDGSVANSRRISQLLVVKQRDAIPVARWQGGKGVVGYYVVRLQRSGIRPQHVLLFCNAVLLSV